MPFKKQTILMSHFYITCLSLFLVLQTSWAAVGLLDPSSLEMFVDELPDMPRIQGYDLVYGYPKSKLLNIGMFEKKWKFHRDLPPTPVFAFGISKETATVPGQTIEVLSGTETYVTWRNFLPNNHILPWDPTIPTAIPADHKGVPTVVHLHGTIGEPESDGFSKSWFTAGFEETGPTWSNATYHYINNQQPGNLWYHDHALGLTRVNILAGLIGAYIIRQPAVEDPLELPRGDEFDRPLVIADRSFYTNGYIYMNQTGDNPTIHPQWQPEYFGNFIAVNGKIWPRMSVQRRKYRFRIINASNARFYNFFLSNGLNFTVVGSDSAYLGAPVTVNETLLAPSEIVDIIVDFSKSDTDYAILQNNAVYPYPSGDSVNDYNGMVMKFIIEKTSTVDTSKIPSSLIQYPSPDLSRVTITPRYISLYEYESATGDPTHLLINAKPFDDPVTETPKVGTSEVWYVINLTEDNHPVHIHLGLFTVLEQTKLVNESEFKTCMTEKNDAVKCQISKYAAGATVAVPAQESGWKNVYKMKPGYVTKLVVRFGYIHSNESYTFDATAEPGYVYHCHILDHEDNTMMRPLKLVT